MKRFLFIIAAFLLASACTEDEFKLMVYESEDAYFELDPHLTSIYFHVATNKSFTLSSDESWIPVGKDSQGSENSWVRLNFDPNMTGSDREGYVTFTSNYTDETQQVRFLQKPYYYFNVGSEGGKIEIPLRDVPVDTYYVSSGEEWLSCSTEKEVKKVFIISASETTSSEERTGYVYLKYEDQYVYVYPVNQAGLGGSSEPEPEPEPEPDPNPEEIVFFEEYSNCHIVSEPGAYAFHTFKGNSDEFIEGITSAEVLWESFGTSEVPEKGDLINYVKYSDGNVIFKAKERKGNALIAVKDASGKILWSWHIWLTDKPQDQVYNNNAGTMMDRNLGATSAEPGDVGALGLLYQWGRKDPFLGGSFISYSSDFTQQRAAFTITWPSNVFSNSSTGTIEYATGHPTIFILRNGNNGDWYYTGNETTDNTRWQSEKTVYDPCPAGYRVPDGVWSKAFGTSGSYQSFDSTNKGFNFGKSDTNISLTDESTCWYPAAGYLYFYDGSLNNVGSIGNYWSCSSNSNSSNVYNLYLQDVTFSNSFQNSKGNGLSVRCLKENSSSEPPASEEPSLEDYQSFEGSANSYIVSEPGKYKIRATKGNSDELVGELYQYTAEVLWESFGTDVAPNTGDLLKSVSTLEDYIIFSIPSPFKEGNAAIAAKDKNGKILWSWHIWLTDKPRNQKYKKGAIVMDRNLGATSATPGDVGALGLLYQWGRKDPFLGSSSISSSTPAKSTITWPSAVSSDSSNGTISYATEHPTTVITYNGSNYDWYYTGDSSTDDTRWQSEKTVYDPCPAGYRVPDGGSTGIWSIAFGTSDRFDENAYDSAKGGFNFGSRVSTKKLTDTSTDCWYPSAGYLYYGNGSLYNVGSNGGYWSCSPNGISAYNLYFSGDGSVYPSDYYSGRAGGFSVRCVRE